MLFCIFPNLFRLNCNSKTKKDNGTRKPPSNRSSGADAWHHIGKHPFNAIQHPWRNASATVFRFHCYIVPSAPYCHGHRLSVYFLVSLVATHLANGILKHGILLIEVVYGLLALCIVVHRTLEEEAQEALYSVTSCTCCKVA